MLKLSKEHQDEIQECIGKVVRCDTDYMDIRVFTENHVFVAECIKRDGVVYFKVRTNNGWLEFPLTEG